MTELSGAVVLVVGASGVLGGEISKRLEAAGATVVRAGRNPGHLGGPDAFLADLTDETAAAALIAASLRAHDRLDGVVIAAGVVAFGPASAVTDATLDRLFETNALAPIRLIREAAAPLEASAAAGRKPFVVTLSGIVAESPTAGLAAYSASKAALAAFVQASARELRRVGIRLLDARPGHTETGLATRAIAGTAPAFPPGLDPAAVAERIVRAIVDEEKDLPSSAF
ncbi:SDR family NAD(P)-dependent oxidoreductase [Lacisediminihabitans sp. FW035]